jgi:hypothetical protein
VQLISRSEGISSKSNFALSAWLVLAENGQSLIDKDPKQPAAKGALVFEARRIPRGLQPAVFDSGVSPFRTAKNATRDEMEQSVATPESDLKCCGVFVSSLCNQEIVLHESPNTQSIATQVFSCAYRGQQILKTGTSLRGPLKW